MAPPLLFLRDVHLRFGAQPLLDGAEISVSAGDRICLVGRNGSGKSTLLKVAAAEVEPERGERFLQPGTSLRYLPQEPDLSAYATVLDYVEAGLDATGEAYRIPYLLDALGLDGAASTADLSGGEARRAALARVLAPEPDILLLDEPTNHLDLAVIEWLEQELSALRSAIVTISHDRRFLETLSRATVWIDRGVTRRLDQGFAAFEAWRDRLLDEEEQARHKLDRKIEREQHWLTFGVTARRKRNVRRLDELQGLRKERREQRRAVGVATMTLNDAEVSGRRVIEAISISKRFGDRPIVEDFSIRILRGDRIGIVGPNGAGKTTLIRLLTGELPPDSGVVRLGTRLDMVTLDQKREALDPATSLADALTDGRGDYVQIGENRKHVAGYMKDFLFAPEQARTPVGVLSGGERGRLMLARALAKPSNLLVLDEPTNDLDLETLDLLQEMIGDYPGTVIIVSHDRDFLDRCVTSTVLSEGHGRWQDYAGGYADMVAQRGSGVGRIQPQQARRPKAAPAERPLSSSPPRQKLSFKDKHALETLPKRMEALQAEIAGLQERLADPSLYRRDPDGFNRLGEAIAARQRELATAEEEWLSLEILREAIEG